MPFGDLNLCIDKLVKDESFLTAQDMSAYSRMKYGMVEETHTIANSLYSKIIDNPVIIEALLQPDELFISSAAYGSVPTASLAIMESIVDRFATQGLNIRTFKIEREGSFHQANYGSLDIGSRQRSLSSRQIYISDEVQHLITNKTILIIDDLRATGSHESKLFSLLNPHTTINKLLFAYPIAFETEFGLLSPNFESVLNNAQITNLDDLLLLAETSEFPLRINARLIKFIFLHGAMKKEKMTKLLHQFGYEYCLALHAAAISSDGYFGFDAYRAGFKILQDHLRGFKEGN